MGVIIAFQLLLIPILGLILFGMHNERKSNERLLKDALKALQMIAISRGRHIK